MTQNKFIQEEQHRTPQQQPRILRFMLLAMITVSGVLMALIVASETKEVAQFQSIDKDGSTLFNSSDRSAPILLIAPDASSDSQTHATTPARSAPTPGNQRPSVGQMPRDRTPVRRAGVSVAD